MNDLSLFLDIIVCIDVSANMNPVFEKIKQFTLSLPSSIKNYMQDIPFDNYQLRIKIITFRDYGSDSEPMTESPFYTFPDQSLAFKSFVDSLKTKRFSNGPKNALEAIALALKSEWTTGGDRRRHAVCIFTGSPALPLGARANCPSYPQGMPADLNQLEAWWEGTDQSFSSTYQPSAGHLVAFVPKAEPWLILQEWNRCLPTFFNTVTDLENIDIQDIIDLILFYD